MIKRLGAEFGKTTRKCQLVCVFFVLWHVLDASKLAQEFCGEAYFVEVVNGGVDGVCLDALHAFWLLQAQQKKVEGNIDEEARDARA